VLRNGIDLHTISPLAWAPTQQKPNLHELMTSDENQEYPDGKFCQLPSLSDNPGLQTAVTEKLACFKIWVVFRSYFPVNMFFLNLSHGSYFV